MPLLNVTVKNFKQTGILPTDSTSLQQDQTTGASSPAYTTLAKSALITLTPNAADAPNDAGGEGYWTIGTNNITIGGITGQASGYWLWYGPEIGSGETGSQGGYWCHSSNKLKDTEYDPGGGASGGFGNFNGQYCHWVGGTFTCVDSSYSYKIGHDFWKYHLKGVSGGEPYEPTHGLSQTYYRHWNREELQDIYDSATSAMLESTDYTTAGVPYGVLEQALDNWSPHIHSIVAVNSMPLLGTNASNFKAQQGNKVFIIVILNDGVTGQDIIDAGGVLTVDIDGGPEFIEFDIPVPENDDWDIDDLDIGTTSEWFEQTNDDSTNIDFEDGDDADEIIDDGNFVNEIIDLSLDGYDDGEADADLTVDTSGDENGDGWGDAGLTDDAIDGEEVNNTTDYDSVAEDDSNR